MSSSASQDEVEDIVTAEVARVIDEIVLHSVARSCAAVTLQRAAAAAFIRHGGNALAKLASHEDAFLTHTKLARRHQERMSQVQGARRR
ncbi:hypothetical protein [Phenylobacterium conjunctum]|uniref:Uncharacterized protein n=1 Tax=Phenylobacterium conjunctum TaxID=1298959 RepID=A0ABW3SXT1_9CAUL